MKKSVDEAKDALLGIWDKLTLTIKPTDKEMLGANDKIEISGEFNDLQIKYTIMEMSRHGSQRNIKSHLE